MSIEAMAKVWRHSTMEGTALLLLLALADHANDQGEAWPSVRNLADKIRRSERATQYLLRKLERSGELEIDTRRRPITTGGSLQFTNLYRLTVVQRLAPGEGQPAAPGGATSRRGGATAIAPESSVEPSVEPSTTPPLPPQGDEGGPSLRKRLAKRPVRDIGLQVAKEQERADAEEVFVALAAHHGWPDTPPRRAEEVPRVLDLLRAGFPKAVIIDEGARFEGLLSVKGLHYRLNTRAVGQAEERARIDKMVERYGQKTPT